MAGVLVFGRPEEEEGSCRVVPVEVASDQGGDS